MYNKIIIRAVILISFTFIAVACSSDNTSGQADIRNDIKEKIPGLEVSGTRSEKNVINNVWPVICRAQELYQERLKDNPGLNGMVKLKIFVEFNGEIGAYSIVRSTLDDPVFEGQLMRVISFMDFDFYGPHNSETEILLPIHFKP